MYSPDKDVAEAVVDVVDEDVAAVEAVVEEEEAEVEEEEAVAVVVVIKKEITYLNHNGMRLWTGSNAETKKPVMKLNKHAVESMKLTVVLRKNLLLEQELKSLAELLEACPGVADSRAAGHLMR